MQGVILEILFILMLVAINAFFSASEIAIISLNDNKIRKMADSGSKKAQILINLVKEPSRFLATIQVGITFASFFASASAAQSFSSRLSGVIKWSGIPLPETTINSLSLIIVVVILSYVSLVLGELVPKRLAMHKSQEISMIAAKPINTISKITSPFIKFLTASTDLIVRIFGVTLENNNNKITEEEIRMMVDVGEEKGIIRETEKEMIDNIFEFDDTQIYKIMTHRTSIIGIPIDASEGEVYSTVITEQFSRIPVYEQNIDNIIGILHTKDLIKYLGKDASKEINLKELIRKPFFVPRYKKTDELFKDLQISKNHMAIVIDEYGGTAGLVTIEDLLEEIVGNIFDEYDEEEKDFEKVDDNTFLVKGTVSLEDIREFFEVNIPTDEYDTLSGFIIGKLGRIPDFKEELSLEFSGLVFKIEESSKKRIEKIKICKI